MRFFETRIKIEVPEFILTANNNWYQKYKLWKEIWAKVKLKNISRNEGVYFFCVDGALALPKNFRVNMNNKIFIPTQSPLEDRVGNKLIFHAVFSDGKK